MTENHERATIRRAREGDREASGRLFRAHLDAVYAFAFWRVGGDRAAAEEVTQETFLEAWVNLHRFDPARPFSAWVIGIARRKLARRRRAPAPPVAITEALLAGLTSPEPLPTELLEREEVKRAVALALTSLGDRHRHLLLRKYVHRRSQKEIAGEEGTSVEAVNSALQRARHALRDALGALGKEKSRHDVA